MATTGIPLMRLLPRLALAAGLLAVAGAARPAAAQLTQGQFRVTPQVGLQRFDPASSIDNAARFGLSTDYAVTRNFSLGLWLGSSQPETNGTDFLTAQTFGDTTRILAVKQSLDIFDFGASAQFLPGTFGRLSPYLQGGVGLYQIHLDPQVAGGLEKVTKPLYLLGAGTSVRLGRGVAFLVDVRDHIYSDYDRDKLFAATPADFPYAEFVPAARASKSTLNNFTFSIGFSFTPTRAGAPEPTDTEDDR